MDELKFEDLKAGMTIVTDFSRYEIGAIDTPTRAIYINGEWLDFDNLRNPVVVES